MIDFIPALTLRPVPYQRYPMRHDRLLQEGTLLWQQSYATLHTLLDQLPVASDVLINLKAQQPALSNEALDEGLKQHWIEYWNGRAPRSPHSRRAQAEQAFTGHLQAAAQLAYYHGQLTLAQLEPLLTLLADHAQSDEPTVYVETLALQFEDGEKLKAAGMLVMTLDGDAPVAQLLYVPGETPALLAFANREALQNYLLQHSRRFWPALTRHTTARVALSFQSGQISSACKQWLSQSRQQYQSLASSTALQPFTELPALEVAELDDSPEAYPGFGNLSPDVTQSQRWTQTRTEHDAMVRLLGDEHAQSTDGPAWRRLNALRKALTDAQDAASQAAAGLLDAQKLSDLYRLRYLPNAHYTALYQARIEGLRAELALQQALGHISQAQAQPLQARLAMPGQPIPDGDQVVAAAVSVSTLTVQGATTTTQTEELPGVAVFAQAQTLRPASEPGALLLYWPGVGGGLQLYQSLPELEQALLRQVSSSSEVSLNLSPVAGDIFDYGLQAQLYECEEAASKLIHSLPAATHLRERADALQRLVQQTYQHLQVPTHAARDRAYVQLTEQAYSQSLTQGLPAWLKQLPVNDRERLRGVISDYIRAMRLSYQQLQRDLPDAQQFAQGLVQQRLRRDFELTAEATVELDIPDAVIYRKEPVAGSGAPGTPQQTIAHASEKRTLWSLETLAQHNIDAPLLQRMRFMDVRVQSTEPSERARLIAGIDIAYLRKTVTDLNLAQAYEDRIRTAFMGSAGQHPFAQAYQRECLVEPVRLMLQMQGEYARHQGTISTAGLRLLTLAIDASDSVTFKSGKHDVQLLAARLQVGGRDTNELPTTLSGVTFVHDRHGGLTLLYLPDSPDHRSLREYANLEQARRGLFALCVEQKMVTYLAGRAITGDFANHQARIKEAALRNFDGLISVGGPWPSTTSLANHLVDAHMGRLIEAQRLLGRSNDALYLEQAALSRGNVFDYIKMAFGVLPFIGTALAVYDLWTAANNAVSGLLKGDLAEALNQLEAVLAGLIDAVIDTVPGSASAPNARLTTRARQWSATARRLGAPEAPARMTTVARANPFAGYHYTGPLSLSNVQPGAQGLYRNIYRHAEGDFIVRDGVVYRVQLHDSPRTWRLYGTAQKTYRQPIALDAAGRWETHGTLYGTLINEGLAGGGGVLGYLGHRAADGLQPLWPAAIRDRLPRWLVDRQYRRHFELASGIDEHNRLLREQLARHEPLISGHAAQPVLRPLAEAACASDIAKAKALHAQLEEHAGFVTRDFLRRNRQFRSEVAYIIAGREINAANIAKHKAHELSDALNQSKQPGDLFDLPQHLMRQHRRKRVELLEQMDLMEQRLEQAQHWAEKVTDRADRATLRDVLDSIDPADMEIARASNLTQLVHKTAALDDLSAMFHLLDTAEQRNRFHHALESHYHLQSTKASLRERQNVLRSSRQIYADYRAQLNVWKRNRPERFELDHMERMNRSLDRLIEQVDRTMPRLSNIPRPPHHPNQPTRRVFETHDHDFFIGDEGRSIDGEQVFTLTGTGGRIETYRKSAGKWHLQTQPHTTSASSANLPVLRDLLAEGQHWLDATPGHERRVESYAVPGEPPANLEDLMVNQGKQLELRAQAIERQAPDHRLAKRLRERARELRAKGRAMRIRQSMDSQTPTEGYLDYLLEQRQVEIIKLGHRRDIGVGPGQRDFLQEYEVSDISARPAKPLWYVHFHYRREGMAFEQFEKAHIKRLDQRLLGLSWQQGQGADAQRIWRGPLGKPLAVKHFAGL